MATPDPPLVPVQTARRLLLGGAGLLADPGRRAGPAAVLRAITAMGFVQVDTIQAIARAHQHILATRFDAYHPRMLRTLLERDRALFEHWTHDASIIPAQWYAMWKVRFARYRERGHSPNSWWARRIGGKPEAVIEHVLERIRDEGPLGSRDFDHRDHGGRRRGESAWWGWKPQKAALEFLWRTGELSVSRRERFQKIYDLAERVLPECHAATVPSDDEHREWACRNALDRLGIATPSELSGFLGAISTVEARAWAKDALARGEVAAVRVAAENGARPRAAIAVPDWADRAKRLPDAPERMRLLSPFDPAVRDRLRMERLFGFDYRFEAFVPLAKRRYGYFVLPVLEGERLVARVDPRLDRGRGVLEVRGPWWERGVRATPVRRAALRTAAEQLAAFMDAGRVDFKRA